MCGKFQTGHKCRLCEQPCCNFCNTVAVEEMTDIVCPKCSIEDEFMQEDVNPTASVVKRGKGRPRNIVPPGQILIPLVKKKRGRPSTKTKVEVKPKQPRGRPSKASNFLDETSEESEADECDENLS